MIFPFLPVVPVFSCCHYGNPSIWAAWSLIGQFFLSLSVSGLLFHLKASVCICASPFVYVYESISLCEHSTGRPAGTWAQRWWWWAASWWGTPLPSGSLGVGYSAAQCWRIPSSACSTFQSHCREPSVSSPLPPPQHHHPYPVAFPWVLSLHTTPRHLVLFLDYLRRCPLVLLSTSAQLRWSPPLLLLPLCRCTALPRPAKGGSVPIYISESESVKLLCVLSTPPLLDSLPSLCGTGTSLLFLLSICNQFRISFPFGSSVTLPFGQDIRTIAGGGDAASLRYTIMPSPFFPAPSCYLSVRLFSSMFFNHSSLHTFCFFTQ